MSIKANKVTRLHLPGRSNGDATGRSALGKAPGLPGNDLVNDISIRPGVPKPSPSRSEPTAAALVSSGRKWPLLAGKLQKFSNQSTPALGVPKSSPSRFEPAPAALASSGRKWPVLAGKSRKSPPGNRISPHLGAVRAPRLSRPRTVPPLAPTAAQSAPNVRKCQRLGTPDTVFPRYRLPRYLRQTATLPEPASPELAGSGTVEDQSCFQPNV